MCNPVSGWAAIIGGEVKLWISEQTDSHQESAHEFGLRDNGTRRLGAWECRPDPVAPSPDTEAWPVAWDSAATEGMRGKPQWTDEERAEVERAIRRACGRYVVTDGEHDWRGVRMFAFGTAIVHGQISGDCRCYDTAQSHGQSGGDCRCFGSSQSHGQTGGVCECRDSAQGGRA